MEKANKYRIIDANNPRCGKKFKGIPTADLGVIDLEEGEEFDMSQVELIPEKHAAYFGIYLGRLGLFLFGREYIKYHSLQFGLAVDHIKHDDAYLDIELKFLMFGIGIRFTWLSRQNYYGK